MIKSGQNIKELIRYSDSGITSIELAKTEKINITLFCMAKGTELSEHASSRDGFVFVLEGKGIFNLEGAEIRMLSGAAIFMKKNAAHSLKAEENTSFLLLLSLMK